MTPPIPEPWDGTRAAVWKDRNPFLSLRWYAATGSNAPAHTTKAFATWAEAMQHVLKDTTTWGVAS